MTTPSSEALADPERRSERPITRPAGGRQHHCDRRPVRTQACPQGPSPGTASAVGGLPGLSGPPAAGSGLPSPPRAPPGAQTRGSWRSRSQQQSHTCSFPLSPPVAGKMAFALRTVTTRCLAARCAAPRRRPAGWPLPPASPGSPTSSLQVSQGALQVYAWGHALLSIFHSSESSQLSTYSFKIIL